jgi:glutathione peroxidase
MKNGQITLQESPHKRKPVFVPSDWTIWEKIRMLDIEGSMNPMNVYDFKVTDNKGNQVDLASYKGKVLLIVNTATECGFTPQYADLEKLYKAYKDKGLEILDFPCDQFGHQAPGTSGEIAQFCTSRFGVTFPQFAKIEVNGVNTLPLYSYLKSQKGFAGFRKEHPITPILVKMLSKADPDYEKKPDIKWNFTKFLIDRKGNVVQRFEPTEDLKVVEQAVQNAL